jgi:hypothetical protein
MSTATKRSAPAPAGVVDQILARNARPKAPEPVAALPAAQRAPTEDEKRQRKNLHLASNGARLDPAILRQLVPAELVDRLEAARGKAGELAARIGRAKQFGLDLEHARARAAGLEQSIGGWVKILQKSGAVFRDGRPVWPTGQVPIQVRTAGQVASSPGATMAAQIETGDAVRHLEVDAENLAEAREWVDALEHGPAQLVEAQREAEAALEAIRAW